MTRNKRLDILIPELIIKHNKLVDSIKLFNPIKYRREGNTDRTMFTDFYNMYWQKRINHFVCKYGNECEIKQLNIQNFNSMTTDLLSEIKDYSSSFDLFFPIPESLKKDAYNDFHFEDSVDKETSDYSFTSISFDYCIETELSPIIKNGYEYIGSDDIIDGVKVSNLKIDNIDIQDKQIIDVIETAIFKHIENKNINFKF